MKTLKLSSKGPLVKQLQLLLNILPDGIFGPQTHQAVLFFQKSQNITVDGIVGPVTWSLLYDGWEILNNPNNEEEIYSEYYLPNHGYHNQPTEKKHIFLHHTAGWQNPYRVIDDWGERPHKIATEFVIGGQSIHNDNTEHDGKILKAIPNNCWAWHLGIGHQPLHRESIGIELCSFGRLTKGYFEKEENGKPKIIKRDKNTYFTYVGQEVNPEQVEELNKPFKEFSYYHKYSEKQIKALKTLLLHLANKHSIDIREGLPNFIRKEGVKAFDFIGTKKCINSPGIWSHSNVISYKDDIAPQEGLVEMLLGL
ncbi:peptidoglycan recognition protein family protein [Brumimicrobium aurantiacum]|uniref:Peptidoglycan binding-like domain-containing protein n=1 Tax=Brumimicrobium aurantiacum TaxID=1737063 RepID=A0A3E1EUK4_9FLAO|nr:peptidoglycan-binding protein [Brumimicrobium aurantiacum]RFC53192.1 hypothetical protein DXU93_14070 [Brumimicrobium aurantiacum]